MTKADWLSNEDIYHLMQPRRREKALRAARINTITELVALDLDTLRSIPGITSFGISELKRALELFVESRDAAGPLSHGIAIQFEEYLLRAHGHTRKQ